MISRICLSLCTFFIIGNSLKADCSCDVPPDPSNILADWKRKTSDKPAKELDMLVTGCARSGTLYITRVFQKCGLGVKHENWEPTYGMVSWPMAVNTKDNVWGPPSKDFTFKHIFHQVRHPLKAIASQMTDGTKVVG